MEYFWLDKHLQEWQSAMANDHKPQAVIINGDKGLGKHELLSAVVNDLMCRKAAKGFCGTCQNCRLLAAGHHPDVVQITPEKGTIKVSMIRELTEFFTSTPHCSDFKVAMIDQAETMNVSAANALLKVLEEPPSRGVLFLLTDNKHQLMPTIKSRCISLDVVINEKEQQDLVTWLEDQTSSSQAKITEALIVCGGQPLTTREFLAETAGTLSANLDQLYAAVSGQQSTSQTAKTLTDELQINDWAMIQRYCLQVAKSNLNPKWAEVCDSHALSLLIKKSPKVTHTVIKIADLIQQFMLHLNTQIKTQLLLESYLIEMKNEFNQRS